MNFTELLNNGSSHDDLNEPHLTYDFPLSQYHSSGSTFEETYTTEAHIGQEKPCAPSSKKSQKQSQGTINFSPEEDKLLIATWLNTSLDPIKGSDQKKNQFWKRITQYFEDHKSWPDERTEKSPTNRWSKISFSVSRFCGHYVAVEHLRTDVAFSNVIFLLDIYMSYSLQIQEAKTVYKDKEGHQFGFDHCWTLLRFQQKWMVEHKKIEVTRIFKAPPAKNQITIDLEDDNGYASEPAPLKRPIGRKAAKEANKKAKSNEQGDDDEKESSKVRSELEEFRARRLESDRVKAEQLKLLIDIKQKQVALREKEIELQARSEEIKIISMDTSSTNPLQAEYIISLQREILAKRAGKNGNE
ncbi:glutathione S-transferase T3-like [Asparagus officinalis]|uniref:glutathione S-transferase T3-like n=1 Tax=Asparagus officinalis TaxID=4686 RepID=UPI00098E77CA|nr:glutathione S-transferase T3-like [Asparagus officinalis]